MSGQGEDEHEMSMPTVLSSNAECSVVVCSSRNAAKACQVFQLSVNEKEQVGIGRREKQQFTTDHESTTDRRDLLSGRINSIKLN